MKRLLIVGFLVISALSVPADAATRKIHTVAGAYIGNGKQATLAAISPTYAAMDARGNFYLVEQTKCRIRKINVSGVISPFAGTGVCGFSGDNGPAKKAQISFAAGIVADSHGNVFFVDQDNERVRQISSSGVITTVAGNGQFGFDCGEGIPALQSCFSFPAAIAVDDGSQGEILYISNTLVTNNIRAVSLATGLIATVVGQGQSCSFPNGDGGPALLASLCDPEGLAFDPQSHTLWISESGKNVIRIVDNLTGIIDTFYGTPNCDIEFLCRPKGISLDATGNLYVADWINSRVVKLDVPSAVVHVVAGIGKLGFDGDGGTAAQATLSDPQDVVVDKQSNILIADSGNGRIRKVDQTGTISTIAGGNVNDGAKSFQSAFDGSSGLAFDKAGNLYIVDSGNNRLRLISTDGSIRTIAGTGISGDTGDGGDALHAELYLPELLAVDSSGNIYVYEIENQVIRKINPTGTISTFASASITVLTALAVDASGNLYAAEQCAVRKFTPNGASSIVVGNEQSCGYSGDGIKAIQAQISNPQGLAFDSVGNLYISDQGNARVRVVNTQGTIDTIAGNGTCSSSGDGGPAKQATLCPRAIAADSSGNLYIVDGFLIRVINKSGTIAAYAGTGVSGYNGNGLPALGTNLFPLGLAVSPKGIVYYTDVYTDLVRKIQ